MIKKKLSAFLILAFALLAISPFAFATTAPQRIFDYAGLLEPEELNELTNKILADSITYSTDIAILTVDDIGSYKDTDAYTQNFVESNRFGFDYDANLVILTIDMDTRTVLVSAYGTKEQEIFPSSSCTDIANELAAKNLKSSDYHGACIGFLEAVKNYTNDYTNADHSFWGSEVFTLGGQAIVIFIALAVAGIALLIAAHNSGGKVTVNAATYLDSSNSKMVAQSDRFTHSDVVTVHIDTTPNNGSGFSGGSHSSGGAHF